MSNIAELPRGGAVAVSESQMLDVLRSSLYPGAKDESIRLVLSYCKAAGLDPLQKPVHIVPMWDKNSRDMRDVVMPGIELYRVKAARTGQYAGCSEPEFGPDVTQVLGGIETTFPAWCRMTVRRIVNGSIAEFTAVERWTENYATAKRDSAQPNSMWAKRPYGQLAKCAEAQALRKGFPEIGSGPTADEMAGKSIDMDSMPAAPSAGEPDELLLTAAREAAMAGTEKFRVYWKSLSPVYREQLKGVVPSLKAAADEADARTVDAREPGSDDDR
jgi:phage recombination protein Bet